MTRIRQAALALVAAAVAAGAVASGASASTTATAARANASIYLPGIFVVSHQPVTVPGRVVTVTGIVRPFVAGQRARVHAFLNGRLIKYTRVRLRPSKNGRYGKFTVRMKSPGAGTVTLKVSHIANAELAAFSTERTFAVLNENVGAGSRGPFVELIQQRLAALHIYLPQSGVYDSYTGLAIDAYHRLLGHGVSQSLDGLTISELLDGVGAFQVKFPSHGVHAEGDLTHQLLALIDGSKVQYIFPISSGKPSTPTILGDFRVYQRTPGYLPDGMYYSDFFIRGYAIHGYDPAPDYPASHGCMRLPIQDAIFVYHWLNYGDWVDTYYR